jgi:hypothetical protein
MWVEWTTLVASSSRLYLVSLDQSTAQRAINGVYSMEIYDNNTSSGLKTLGESLSSAPQVSRDIMNVRHDICEQMTGEAKSEITVSLTDIYR